MTPEPAISEEMTLFLPQAFRLKAIVDYEFGPESDVPADRAADASSKAVRFVGCIAALVGPVDNTAPDAAIVKKKRKE